MRGNCFIGTSGWSYDHWEKLFYPEGLKAAKRLSYYTGQFGTVEVNNTFYRLPSEETLEHWKSEAPEGFIFALKASRFITHLKKLKDTAAPLEEFLRRALLLEEHLGSVLFQLPPRWRCNLGRFGEFLELLPFALRFAFEFRDASWINDGINAMLRKKGAAFCIYSMPGFESPLIRTAPFVYLRFHGAGTLYGGLYPEETIQRWAGLIDGWLEEGADVYAYFNNDAFGHAIANARQLGSLLKNG